VVEIDLRPEEVEARFEAAPAVALLVALQVLLAVVSRVDHWPLWLLPWWSWLLPVAPELALFVVLTWETPRRRLVLMGLRRAGTIALLGAMSAANALLLFTVIGAVLRGTQKSGTQLLVEGLVVWATNVLAFGLWYWAFDRGGPVRRLRADPPPPDFQFPQMENPELAAPGWKPHFIDYLYVSFTNALAFSPTDAMPLSRSAKMLMLVESALSSMTILLVAARAVNILK
jgi:hypothetical protein